MQQLKCALLLGLLALSCAHAFKSTPAIDRVISQLLKGDDSDSSSQPGFSSLPADSTSFGSSSSSAASASSSNPSISPGSAIAPGSVPVDSTMSDLAPLQSKKAPKKQSALIADNSNVLLNHKPKGALSPQAENKLEAKFEQDIKAGQEADRKQVAEDNSKKLAFAQDEQTAKRREAERAEADQKNFISSLRAREKAHQDETLSIRQKERDELVNKEAAADSRTDKQLESINAQEENAKKDLRRQYDELVKQSEEDSTKKRADADKLAEEETTKTTERLKQQRELFNLQFESKKKSDEDSAKEENEKYVQRITAETADFKAKVEEQRKKEDEKEQAKRNEETKKREEKIALEKAAEEKNKVEDEKRKVQQAAEEKSKAEEEEKAVIKREKYSPRNGQVIAQSNRLMTNDWKGVYTYSFWARPFGTRGDWGNLLHKGAVNHHRNPAVWTYPGSLRLHMRSGAQQDPQDWGGYTNWGCDPERQLNNNQWNFVAFTHESGVMKVFFGNEAGQLDDVCTINYPGPVANSGPLYSADPWHSEPTLIMADVRVYNRILSRDEIAGILKKKSGIN